MGTPLRQSRILIAIPSHNEVMTIEAVVLDVRAILPECDVLVIDDGSTDQTHERLARLEVPTATHLCNLGYGHAIQTGIKYAAQHGYEGVITMDADGQHEAAQVKEVLTAFLKGDADVVIGSRYVQSKHYAEAPTGRRLGMRFFSSVVGLLGGTRVYDTSSGLKAIRETAYEVLLRWRFVDFHAESIVYLIRSGFRVSECPVRVAKRTQGASMYSFWSHITYPAKTLLLVVLGLIEANLRKQG